MEQSKKFKVGDLVYLKDVGYPYHQKESPEISWEGASCIVEDINCGVPNIYIRVKPIFPIDGSSTGLFHPCNVNKEDRIWLKNNLKPIVKFQKIIENSIELLQEISEYQK